MTRCDYAACRTLGSEAEDGWLFCPRHLHQHRLLRAEDVARRRLAASVDGLLMPSFDLTPLLNALHRAQPRPEDIAI